MKKFYHISILASIMMIAWNSATAQATFSHAIGIEYLASSEVGVPAILYSPRINIIELDRDLTISLGTHFGLGFNFSSREGATTLAIDLPLVAEVNFGHASQPYSRADYGGFAGIGYGYSKLGQSGEWESYYNSEASGLVINGGFRGYINDSSVGARISYLLNFRENGSNIIGLGVFYTFGQD
ncbi:MAG TPA: hypothetical protein P5514_15685 [Bacteroidales bacterium]|nr:hypothetical protein [Bacteroidales bacterium]HRX98387.1 hypothetical protein [Bacteroidales bacterium]